MKEILSLENKKTVFQALIFYIIWGAGTVLFLFFIVDQGLLNIPASLRFSLGTIVAAIVPFVLSLIILSKKKLIDKPIYIVVLVLSLLGWKAGILIGLLPTLFLTTVKPLK